MKKLRFEATCTCGNRITGDTKTWRHDTRPTHRHTPHPTGTLTQI